MNEDRRLKLHDRIIIEIDKVILSIETMEEETKPIAPDCSLGRITRMDAINNKSVVEASLRVAKSKLAKLRMALSKIDEDGFGNCSRCKNPINEARLMLLPESSLCIRCAT